VEKSSPNISATSVIFKKLPKENNHKTGKNSPYLVTLHLVRYNPRLLDLIPLWRVRGFWGKTQQCSNAKL
jgi:hypothetical protein